MFALHLGAAVAAAFQVGTPTPQVMTDDDLKSIAMPILDFRAKDEFDTPPKSPSVKSKPFSYIVAPRNERSCMGYPKWEYQPVKGTLGVYWATHYLSTSARALNTPTPKRGYDAETYILFNCTASELGTYTAQNGFGAKAEMRTTLDRGIGISVASSYKSKLPMDWQTTIAGEEAKALTQNVRVRISGTLDEWLPSQPLFCALEKNVSFSWGRDRSTEVCLFKGNLELVEVIDARTGEVLHTTARTKKRK